MRPADGIRVPVRFVTIVVRREECDQDLDRVQEQFAPRNQVLSSRRHFEDGVQMAKCIDLSSKDRI